MGVENIAQRLGTYDILHFDDAIRENAHDHTDIGRIRQTEQVQRVRAVQWIDREGRPATRPILLEDGKTSSHGLLLGLRELADGRAGSSVALITNRTRTGSPSLSIVLKTAAAGSARPPRSR